MTFIPTTPPTNDPSADAVPNLAFWPALSLQAFRDGYRVDTTVSDEHARDAILSAARAVNRDLAAWQASQVVAGYATLDAVPAAIYGEDTVHVLNYRAAVYNHARALVTEDYRTYDATREGHDRADAMQPQADTWLARARTAIRAILGVPRSTVELL